jgi:hypothetical protein
VAQRGETARERQKSKGKGQKSKPGVSLRGGARENQKAKRVAQRGGAATKRSGLSYSRNTANRTTILLKKQNFTLLQCRVAEPQMKVKTQRAKDKSLSL